MKLEENMVVENMVSFFSNLERSFRVDKACRLNSICRHCMIGVFPLENIFIFFSKS